MAGEVELRALTKRYDESLAVDAIDLDVRCRDSSRSRGPPAVARQPCCGDRRVRRRPRPRSGSAGGDIAHGRRMSAT